MRPNGYEINFYPAASQQIPNSTRRTSESPLVADAVVEDLPQLLTAASGPKAKPEHVRLHVGYWGDERNCYKWDQSVAVDPKPI
jgi:hypothetical protein